MNHNLPYIEDVSSLESLTEFSKKCKNEGSIHVITNDGRYSGYVKIVDVHNLELSQIFMSIDKDEETGYWIEKEELKVLNF